MSEEAYKLRRCKFPKDLAAIMQLEKQAFGDEAFPVFEFIYLYAMGRETFWVTERDGKIIAYISAYIEEDNGYIASIAVAPNERRKGIAQAMIEKLIEFLKAVPKIKGVSLHVRPSNQNAIALYKKLQFVPVRLIPDYYHDKETGIEMKLEFEA